MVERALGGACDNALAMLRLAVPLEVLGVGATETLCREAELPIPMLPIIGGTSANAEVHLSAPSKAEFPIGKLWTAELKPGDETLVTSLSSIPREGKSFSNAAFWLPLKLLLPPE